MFEYIENMLNVFMVKPCNECIYAVLVLSTETVLCL